MHYPTVDPATSILTNAQSNELLPSSHYSSSAGPSPHPIPFTLTPLRIRLRKCVSDRDVSK